MQKVYSYKDEFPSAREITGNYAGVSSRVFSLDENHSRRILKITQRNSIERVRSDLDFYKGHFPQLIPETQVYNLSEGVGIVQPWINGSRFADMPESKLMEILKGTPKVRDQLINLLENFVLAFQRKRLYPDPVGFPQSNELVHSVNIFYQNGGSSCITLCDTGLSPHEDTLKKHGESAYLLSHNMDYFEKMKKWLELLKRMG